MTLVTALSTYKKTRERGHGPVYIHEHVREFGPMIPSEWQSNGAIPTPAAGIHITNIKRGDCLIPFLATILESQI